jgi:hypothetical protein
MLMGEDNAEVNLLAGGEDEDEAGDGDEAEGETEDECGNEWEYEDGGWWVGTVGVVETLEEAEEAPCTPTGLGPAQGNVQGAKGGDGQVGWEHDLQANECSEGEVAGDEWWDLEPGYPHLKEGGAHALQVEPHQRPPDDRTRPCRSAGAGRPRFRKRPRVTADQQWEKARRDAWLRQALSDGTSDEDGDEEQHGRFAESGRWISELYGLPQHSVTTSGGECSG